MIEITCKKDIEKLNKTDISYVFKTHIEKYLDEMLLRFGCENLSNFGSIFILESEKELETFSPSKASHFINIGLVTPNNETFNITQLFFFEKSYAKIVFVDDRIIENYKTNKSVKVG